MSRPPSVHLSRHEGDPQFSKENSAIDGGGAGHWHRNGPEKRSLLKNTESPFLAEASLIRRWPSSSKRKRALTINETALEAELTVGTVVAMQLAYVSLYEAFAVKVDLIYAA